MASGTIRISTKERARARFWYQMWRNWHRRSVDNFNKMIFVIITRGMRFHRAESCIAHDYRWKSWYASYLREYHDSIAISKAQSSIATLRNILLRGSSDVLMASICLMLKYLFIYHWFGLFFDDTQWRKSGYDSNNAEGAFAREALSYFSHFALFRFIIVW